MKKELELYVHIPFCVRKCAYCDFLSFAVKGGDTARLYDRYFASVEREIAAFAHPEEYEVSSVFFGGGTPSLVPAEKLAKVLRRLRAAFTFRPDAEISLEANPGTLTREKLAMYRNEGINRLSLGLQSADDGELRLLGRIHTWEEFAQNWFLARELGFDNINVDLMSALPGQTCEAWERSLKRVLKLRPEHISAYSLIVEEGTPFFERYGEDARRREAGEECRALPSEETERRMYHRTKEILTAAGYHRYEISNYALAGRECRHNCGYWQRKEYRGFGLGAASLMEERRFSNTRDLLAYLDGRFLDEAPEALDRTDQIGETMMLGLRMEQGVSEEEFLSRFGATLDEIYGEEIKRLAREGLVQRGGGRLRLTERGTDLGNYVMAQFLL